MKDPRFDKPVLLESLPGGVWRVYEGFGYHTDIDRHFIATGPWVVEIPNGFITDFASVPRLFWNIFPPIGNYRNAAIVHDYLYRTRFMCAKVVATCS